MKNVLFVADCFTGGGQETRIVEQIKILKRKRIRFYLLCNKFNPIYKKYFAEVSESLKLNDRLQKISANDVLTDVDTICNFCVKYDIDYIDCHPSMCILPAVLAAERVNTPISFTLHGVASGDFITNPNHLPGRTLYHLAINYGFDKYFAVAEYLTTLYSFLTNVSIVRNGSFLNSIKYRGFKNTRAVAIASRLDVVKAQLVIDFLPSVYKSKAIDKIDIYGDGDGIHNIKTFVSENHLEDKVCIKGWEKDLSKKLSEGDYMLVFGMGRVVLDAILSGTPVGVLGYGGFAGFVNHSNLQDFAKDNLTSWETKAELPAELKHLFIKPSDYIFDKKDLDEFNAEAIWQKYYDTIITIEHSKNEVSQKVFSLLLKNPDADILSDQDLFLEYIRLLADGDRPLSQKLFFAIFQKQFDISEGYKRQIAEKNAQLRQKNKPFLKKILRRN